MRGTTDIYDGYKAKRLGLSGPGTALGAFMGNHARSGGSGEITVGSLFVMQR